MKPKATPSKGFTLIELSIVLVIIGLIVGGILVGQDLIRAAQLRSVTTQFQQYKTAINTFKLKYNALPGDMKNATDFFGVMGGVGCPGRYDNLPTRPGTCNGNGNTKIEATPVNAVTRHNETFGFWDHLAQAGLIEGQYWGVADSGNFNGVGAVVGFNTPASKVPNAGWQLENLGYVPISSIYLIEGHYGNTFYFGKELSSVGYTLRGGALTPAEAFNIDSKIDDSGAGSGNIVSREDGYTCFVGTNSSSVAKANVEYDLAITTNACVLMFRNVFQ